MSIYMKFHKVLIPFIPVLYPIYEWTLFFINLKFLTLPNKIYQNYFQYHMQKWEHEKRPKRKVLTANCSEDFMPLFIKHVFAQKLINGKQKYINESRNTFFVYLQMDLFFHQLVCLRFFIIYNLIFW